MIQFHVIALFPLFYLAAQLNSEEQHEGVKGMGLLGIGPQLVLTLDIETLEVSLCVCVQHVCVSVCACVLVCVCVCVCACLPVCTHWCVAGPVNLIKAYGAFFSHTIPFGM